MEIRTTAGPSRHVQWVIERRAEHRGGPVRQCQLVCPLPPPWPRQATWPDENLVRAEAWLDPGHR